MWYLKLSLIHRIFQKHSHAACYRCKGTSRETPLPHPSHKRTNKTRDSIYVSLPPGHHNFFVLHRSLHIPRESVGELWRLFVFWRGEINWRAGASSIVWQWAKVLQKASRWSIVFLYSYIYRCVQYIDFTSPSTRRVWPGNEGREGVREGDQELYSPPTPLRIQWLFDSLAQWLREWVF